GSTANLNGTFTDPDANDTHTVVINWGDGSPNTTINLATGVTSYSTSHLYVDNPAGSPHGAFLIGITVTDNHGGSGAASTSVTPTVTVSGLPSGTVTFGNTVSGSFSFTDPGVNDGAGPVYWQAVISFGDGLPNVVMSDLVPGTVYNFSRVYYHAGINPITVTV